MAQQLDYRFASPEDIESVLGQKLEKIRLSKNINQSTLATEAGVSRRTITRLENGEGITMDTFIRVMQALGIAEHLQTLLPNPAVRPVERVKLGGRERKRARMKQSPKTVPWKWGAAPEDQ